MHPLLGAAQPLRANRFFPSPRDSRTATLAVNASMALSTAAIFPCAGTGLDGSGEAATCSGGSDTGVFWAGRCVVADADLMVVALTDAFLPAAFVGVAEAALTLGLPAAA